MAAPSALMAIPLESSSAAPTSSVKSAKKQDHLNAGRRRLEAFKKKRREKENTGAGDVAGRDEQQRQLKVEGPQAQIPNGAVQPIQQLDVGKAQVNETARPIFKELPERSFDDSCTALGSKHSEFASANVELVKVLLQDRPAVSTEARRDAVKDDGPWARPSMASHYQVTNSVADSQGTSDENLKQVLKLEEASTSANQDEDEPRRHSLSSSVESVQQSNRMAVASCSRDDFAALEQHIEDLTQEKFSLQRGLETARTLVESLTQENNTLTEHYNQQGATMNELRAEIVKHQAEFRAHKAVVEKLKKEKDKALQECALATEQSRVFASEVISLEEKILKTRSQELKLQKETESLREGIAVCRKQISTVEKDRSNLKSMVDALQEEKKVLLVRLRDAVSTSKVSNSSSQADASTSTDDLVVVSDEERRPLEPAAETEDPVASSTDLPTSIPAEQQSIIESINHLVLELGQEKTSLLAALRMESSTVAQLRAENAELSQKLEHQTQQLELAVAQMARGPLTPSDVLVTQPQVEFMDEGDEVVDRVLQWIKRLFPGGSSSRRGGSKHL